MGKPRYYPITIGSLVPGHGKAARDLGSRAAEDSGGLLVGEGEMVNEEQDAALGAVEREVRGKGACAVQNGVQDVDSERLKISTVLRIGIFEGGLGHTQRCRLIAEEAEGEGVGFILEEENLPVEGV